MLQHNSLVPHILLGWTNHLPQSYTTTLCIISILHWQMLNIWILCWQMYLHKICLNMSNLLSHNAEFPDLPCLHWHQPPLSVVTKISIMYEVMWLPCGKVVCQVKQYTYKETLIYEKVSHFKFYAIIHTAL